MNAFCLTAPHSVHNHFAGIKHSIFFEDHGAPIKGVRKYTPPLLYTRFNENLLGGEGGGNGGGGLGEGEGGGLGVGGGEGLGGGGLGLGGGGLGLGGGGLGGGG